MSDPWTAAIVIFVLVAIAAVQLQAGLRGMRQSRRDRSRRFASLAPGTPAEEQEALRRRASRLGGSALGMSLAQLVMQSGTGIAPAMLGAIWAALSVMGWLALPVPANILARLPVAALVCAGLIIGWLRIKRARRIKRFAEQLPEVIDIIVRSLRAGHPLAVSLGLVAREMPEPAGGEFTLVMNEVSYGRSLGDALDQLDQRVGYPELRFFIAATAIAQQTGGNLGEILSRLSHTLRARFRLARRVRALSAEGRFSGLALSVLPLALFAVIQVASRSYYAEFWATPAAGTVVAVSIGLLAVGNLLIYRLVNFKV